ncbi:hypothetical protein [Xanthomonas tesorieronis]
MGAAAGRRRQRGQRTAPRARRAFGVSWFRGSRPRPRP